MQVRAEWRAFVEETGTVKRIEFIGAPLSHAQTPGILNPVLEAAKEELRVVCRETGEQDLAAYLAAARQDRDIVGLVVTTPLKRAICARLDHATPLVHLTGSSNCIRFDEDAMIGANFDGFGLALAMIEAGLSPASRTILLCGCGGAGAAIAASLVTFNGTKLSIYDPERARTLDFIRRLRAFVPAAIVSAVDEQSGPFDVVINASPVGMNADDPIAIPASVVECAGAVVDIVAAPTTRLRELALARQKIVVAGHAMVRAQAQLLRRFICSGAASEADTMRAEGVTGIPALAIP
jgi:shikimate dehydrogenase